MKSFLVSGRESEEFREVQAHRTHLEKQLVMARADTWGLQWHTLKSGSPHQLIVCVSLCMQNGFLTMSIGHEAGTDGSNRSLGIEHGASKEICSWAWG
jgi:hypothetical protein